MAQSTPAYQDLLGDRYTLEIELGSGGQGAVFRAHDRRLGRAVAIKFLRPDIATLLGPTRFQREIAIAASLSHPNIVPLLDSGGSGDQLYYTMPLVEGESLRTRLRRQSQLGVDEAVRIARDVAVALAYAHDHGYAHRDIKPENIYLTGDRAIVLDFGIARAIELSGTDSVTSGNIVIGTPAYMSPEQGSGQRQLDGRTDIYALGCVLYEMLAGSPPFTGATAQAIIARHLVDPPPALSVVRSTVSPALEEVIRKALAKVPADRYASGTEMVRALEQARRHPGGRALWRRRLTRTALVVVPAAVGAAVWMAWPRTVLDPNKVMGFPLLGGAGVPRFAVEQVEEAIAAAMQDTDPLRWLRARLFLGGTGAGSALPADSATHLARARGARYWLGGSVSTVGDSLVVRLDLFDAKGDSLIASRSESAPRGAPSYVPAFRAVNMLLPRVVGRSTHVAQKYLERHPPAAVANWLAGEVAYRNARYRNALASYQTALAADSTLMPAALKGAMTAAWLAEYDAADSLVQLALRHEAELPAPNRLLAHALVNQFAGDGDSAMYWSRQAAQSAPEWSEAWYQVGEAAYHLWPAGDNLDSVAHSAFRRSLALDPDFAPVVFHLAELAMVSGALNEADSLVKRHRQLSADTAQQLQLELMLRCIRGDRQVDWTPLAVADPRAIQLVAGGNLLAAGGRHLRCAEEAYHAALRSAAPDENFGRRWRAALSLHHLYVARGEFDRARSLADSVVGWGVAAGRGLRIIDALLGAGPDSVGAAEIAWLDQPTDSMNIRRAWYFGEWSSAHDDLDRLERVTHQIRVLATGSGKRSDQVPARVMSARLLLAQGDTARAIDSLSAARPVADLYQLIYGTWEPLAAERLLLARLLLARGRAADALQVAGSFDGERAVLDVAYLRPSLELRRQAAARLGDRSRERELERRLAALSGR